MRRRAPYLTDRAWRWIGVAIAVLTLAAAALHQPAAEAARPSPWSLIR